MNLIFQPAGHFYLPLSASLSDCTFEFHPGREWRQAFDYGRLVSRIRSGAFFCRLVEEIHSFRDMPLQAFGLRGSVRCCRESVSISKRRTER